ncbi:MAG: leucine-rich repeat domain-containing protein [Ruminococcus sp.]|nr:leucine-rich repeat domain-containing protein [Ruminococcus sp.]
MLCIFCMNEIPEGSDKCPHCAQSQNVTTPPHRLLPHTVLSGRYVVGAAKGEGGFGITYIGKDTRLDRIVAIKEFYPAGLVNRNTSASPEVTETADENGRNAFYKGRESFLTEAKTLAKFSGEMGIVHILDFFIENNTAYIVMEYLDGMSLSNKLKAEGTMTPEQTLTILMPVMISLEKVHKQGLIHRDISPSNIMILKNSVKLIDFGAARQASRDGNRSMSLMLKPGYAPEEQYRSKGVQGPWTDVYALCATIYKCITGVTPDEANDRLHNDELKPPSQMGISVDPRFEAALMKGLSVLQQDRYQSIEDLLKDISPFALSGGTKTQAADDEGRTAFSAPEDQSTRYAAVPQNINAGYREPVQMPQYQPAQPQMPQYQPAQPQMPQYQTAQPQMPQGSTVQSQYTDSTYNSYNYAPQMQMPQQPYIPPQMQPQQSEIDRKVAERVKKRKRKKALTAFLVILGIAAVVLLVVYLMGRSGKAGASSTHADEKLEPTSFKDTDASLNFKIDGDYVSFRETAVTPKDISQIKSRKGIRSIFITKCQIPQETMDVMWEAGDISYLSIEQCTGFKDLSPLSKLTTLTNLQVEQCDMGNDVFKGLDFAKMEKLYNFSCLGNPKLTDISFVKTGAALIRSLDISYCDVSDISPVKELKRLYTFNAQNCKISDISALKGLKLSNIHLSGNQIKDISALSDNGTLGTLDLSSNQVDSLKPLENCKDLRNLNLNHNKLTSLSGLEKVIRLEKLECSHNQITELSGITNCTVLYYVNISSNKISDISLLSKNSAKLKSVFLDDNQVSDLSPLGSASGLLALSFNNNQITNLNSIKSCTKLKAISGDNNKITALDVLSPMKELTCISFAHNSISDMAPIEKISAAMSGSMYVLDLSSNNIKKLDLAPSKTYESVLVYNNPLTTLDNVKNIKGLSIAVSYFEGIDLKELGKGYFRLSIIDCPLDKQVAIENDVGRYSVTFSTSEEKEKDTKNKKEAVFKQINS